MLLFCQMASVNREGQRGVWTKLRCTDSLKLRMSDGVWPPGVTLKRALFGEGGKKKFHQSD